MSASKRERVSRYSAGQIINHYPRWDTAESVLMTFSSHANIERQVHESGMRKRWANFLARLCKIQCFIHGDAEWFVFAVAPEKSRMIVHKTPILPCSSRIISLPMDLAILFELTVPYCMKLNDIYGKRNKKIAAISSCKLFARSIIF